MIGVSPAAITHYESGRSVPPSERIAELALALGYPARYFDYRPERGAGRPSQAFFRSLRTARQRQRDQALARAAHALEISDWVSQRVELPPVKLPELQPPKADARRSELEALAAQVREALRLPVGPVANVVRLMESIGILVVRLGGLGHHVDAFSVWADVRPQVILSADKKDKGRSRFDAAHEFGHLVLHPDIEPANRVLERQANWFASSMLMPAALIEPDLPRRAPRRSDWRQLVDAKMRWGVSIRALLFRSRELGLLNESAFRRSLVNLNEEWGAYSEPGDLGEPEQPIVLARALKLIEERKPDSISDLRASTGLPDSEIEEIAAVDLDAQRPGSRVVVELPLARESASKTEEPFSGRT